MAEIRPDVVSDLTHAIDERATDAERAALVGALLARLHGAASGTKCDAATDAERDAATGAATDAERDAATGAATDAATDAERDAERDAASGASSGAATDAATDPATDAATDAASGAATDAATDPATDPATDAASGAERDAATDAERDAASGATSGAATGAATDAERDAASDAATDAERDAASGAERDAPADAASDAERPRGDSQAAETRAALERLLARLTADDVRGAAAVVQALAEPPAADDGQPGSGPNTNPEDRPADPAQTDLLVPAGAAPPAHADGAGNLPATVADRTVLVDPSWLMNLHADLAATHRRNTAAVRALSFGGAIVALGTVTLMFAMAPGMLGTPRGRPAEHHPAAAAPSASQPDLDAVPVDSPILDPRSQERREFDRIIGAAPTPSRKKPAARSVAPKPLPAPHNGAPPSQRHTSDHRAPKRTPQAPRNGGFDTSVNRVLDQIR